MKKTAEEMYSFSSNLWFNKRRVSKTGEVSIYLQVVINGAHTEIPLKLRWPADKVDVVKGELLPKRKRDPDVDDYNLLIATEQGKHTEILRSYRLKKAYIDLDIFRREVQTFDNRESFLGFMITENKARYRDKVIEHKTFRNIKSTITLMAKFDPSWRYDTLNQKFVAKFKRYLMEQDYEPGQVWTKIRDVKAHLTIAAKEPMIFIEPDVLKFPNPQPKWRTTYLNRDELGRLVKFYAEEYMSSHWNQVLRAFLFTCFTSLRISDVYRINSDWRVDENYIDFIPKKNEKKKKRLIVPIMPMANQFVIDSQGMYFNLPSEQEYNRTLKEIAEKVNIGKRLTLPAT
ncbi:phage integrase SAM-like domain-containing protein [Mucilaginibacter sp. Bleaf8]|uniref:phage integrase SAM-like domain-containing protein n=1 Tax=Mucilaginibacter sp. Bleaf8 TaxID=2834430 RepID=UPI001BCF8D0B|nr:phage integrase SAM-like domain-containing protein [Mucilaginibacter sp. Bleaf8]MBS7565123.1 phage integrase SAM-like domain-containing protein [Mucilaginibacter sp. Bleaf8]